MATDLCPVCGGGPIEHKEEKRLLSVPYGSAEPCVYKSCLCSNCGQEVSTTDDSGILYAFEKSRYFAMKSICHQLEEKGFKKIAIERITGIPFNTIDKAIGNADPVVYALLVMLITYPEVLEDEEIFKRDSAPIVQ